MNIKIHIGILLLQKKKNEFFFLFNGRLPLLLHTFHKKAEHGYKNQYLLINLFYLV